MRSPQPSSQKIVVIFLAFSVCFPLAAQAAKLHVIIATDRIQPGIGPDMELSRDEFLAAVVRNTPADECIIWEINPNLRKAQEKMQPIRTTIHPFGQELSRNTMLGAIQRLRVAPDDAVLFFYCGHGAYSPQHGTYTLASGDRGQGWLFLSEIRGAIAQKRPKFAAVILDCCNSLRPIPGERRMFVPFAAHREDYSPLFEKLFFSEPKSLVITSSGPNEYSLVVPAIRHARGEQHLGALFTHLFSGELNESMEERLPWEQLLPRVQNVLDKEFDRICKGGVIPLGNGTRVAQARQTIVFRW
jgi:hypothetical protein